MRLINSTHYPSAPVLSLDMEDLDLGSSPRHVSFDLSSLPGDEDVLLEGSQGEEKTEEGSALVLGHVALQVFREQDDDVGESTVEGKMKASTLSFPAPLAPRTWLILGTAVLVMMVLAIALALLVKSPVATVGSGLAFTLPVKAGGVLADSDFPWQEKARVTSTPQSTNATSSFFPSGKWFGSSSTTTTTIRAPQGYLYSNVMESSVGVLGVDYADFEYESEIVFGDQYNYY